MTCRPSAAQEKQLEINIPITPGPISGAFNQYALRALYLMLEPRSLSNHLFDAHHLEFQIRCSS